MPFTIFNKEPQEDVLSEPMFMGKGLGVIRYDQQRYRAFEKLTEKQLSFFWRPEEIDVSDDKYCFHHKLTDAERHIFVSNIQYQTLLDGAATNSIPILNMMCTNSELKSFTTIWPAFEDIHSRSYTHLLRNIFSNPAEIFDAIILNEAIVKRAVSISKYFDDLALHSQLFQTVGAGTHLVEGIEVVVTERGVKERLFLAVCAINALEGIRFFASFVCGFSLLERELLTGGGNILKLIIR